eukprot:804789-Prymnesium_polylepis.1
MVTVCHGRVHQSSCASGSSCGMLETTRTPLATCDRLCISARSSASSPGLGWKPPPNAVCHTMTKLPHACPGCSGGAGGLWTPRP